MSIWIWILGFIVLLAIIKLITMKSNDGESFGKRFIKNVVDCCTKPFKR